MFLPDNWEFTARLACIDARKAADRTADPERERPIGQAFRRPRSMACVDRGQEVCRGDRAPECDRAEGETIAEGEKPLKIFLAVFTTLYLRIPITRRIELQNNSNKLH
ncbi:hypothetical protein [Paraburkholderia phytofirmans]|uniref:Uncharacterized protein n=1 Tax=Paraburkholderia phytofirmans TaxID=261302 RepID=A0ABW9BTA4_9BURK|nr:hypothetical protein [Paraburkholderia phytofirmans]